MSQDNQQDEGLPKVDQALANDASIVKGHARARREPIAGSPVAFFMMIAFLIVITFAFFVGRRYFHPSEDGQLYLYDREEIYAFYNQPEVEIVEIIDGAKLYAQQCVACHQATGVGVPGAFPPLVDSEWVKDGDGNVPIRVVLAGIAGPITVKGVDYNGAMPAFGPVWNDKEIAAVVTHIRASWGNDASAVTPEQVADIRAEIGSRGNWSEAELKEFL